MRTVDAVTMRDIDAKAQTTFGIPELLLMESAGREASQVILESMKGRAGSAVFFCGKGNNGGDGFVAARYLLLQEVPVALFLIGERGLLKGSARTHFEMLERFGCPIYELKGKESLSKATAAKGPFLLAVDALLGIGLTGDVRDPYRSVIHHMNRLGCPVFAIDIPSGLCATTGQILGSCVKADQTITFGLPKKGFYTGKGPSVTGKVTVKNIGYPKVLLL